MVITFPLFLLLWFLSQVAGERTWGWWAAFILDLLPCFVFPSDLVLCL